MPTPFDNILSSLTNFEHKPKLAQAYIAAVDVPDNENPPWVHGSGDRLNGDTSVGGSAVAFQYWPETVQDTRPSNWVSKAIPGGSHPIYQWSHGGERSVSFTAMFTTDTEPSDAALEGGGFDPYGDQKGTIVAGRDIDIRSAISWLRWYTYPSYGGSIGGGYIVNEPAKCMVVLPNTGIGWSGEDYIIAVMTQCDVTYQALFPSGFPRIVEVSLGFSEVVQHGGRVSFHDRTSMLRAQSVLNNLPVKE